MKDGYSLRWRLLGTAALVLVIFMGLTGLALDRAYRHSAELGLQDRLQARIYALMGVADVGADGELWLPPQLREERFNSPGSGLYAQVADKSGAVQWRSASLLETLPVHPEDDLGVLKWRPVAVGSLDLMVASMRVLWELSPTDTRALEFSVAEDHAALETQINGFRQRLVLWLGIASGVLLVVQLLMLHWGLAPLRRVARDLEAMEQGRSEHLRGRYPNELQPLTNNLNALLDREREQRDRYRNALGDLAHSLKTPLAVMQSAVQANDSDALLQTAKEQTERMRQTVDYQLQRAATAGQGVLRPSLKVKPQLQRLVDSLQKVHSDKHVTIELDVDAQLEWCVDEGDLLELAGNLMDNALKWTQSKVRVSTEKENGQHCLIVEDDGPGIDEDQIERVRERGGRADDATPGHGIGLAIVQDILAAYGGELKIGRSELGGARFIACFRFRE